MLCSLAHYLPPYVERFLDSGRSLNRRFREETITDILMGGMLGAGTGAVIVDFPNEPVTGADMEWNFVDKSKSKFFRILLQAKQVYGQGEFWSRHNYRELFHISGSSQKLQAETLCDTTRADAAAYPLYILYNSAYTCNLARKDNITNISGINIVDGYVVEGFVKAANTQKLRTNNKSLKILSPGFSGLSAIFCPQSLLPIAPILFFPSVGGAPGGPPPIYFSMSSGRRGIGIVTPPTPDEIRGRLLAIQKRSLMSVGAMELSKGLPPMVPAISHRIPDDVRAKIEGERSSEGPREKLNRWRVTFLSRSPGEGEGD